MNDTTELKVWFFDCDYGKSFVHAVDADQARRKAIREVGTYAQVSNVRLATEQDIAWQKSMGGIIP